MGNVVGCDISKEWFDAEITGPDHRRLRVDNKSKAIDCFVRELAPGSVVGMEATGQMHELLAEKLVKHGHTVFVINPRWIRLYAKGLGIRGKTDRTDAALIARFVAAEGSNLHAYQPPSRQHKELRKLVLRRRKLVELRVATRQSLGAEARALIAQFNTLIKRIEGRIAEIIESIPHWQRLAERLRTEPGVGKIVAAHLVETLTRMPFKNADAFIAHTGLDPRPNDSGQKHGRRRLTHHGDALLRSMLFMAAMKASQRGHWQEVYQVQRRKGLPSTAALVIVARKLARIAFSLFRSGTTYDEARLGMSQHA